MDYIAVKTIDGRDVLIFKQAIVTIGGPRDPNKAQPALTDKASCVVTLVDGKFVAVVESCASLRQRLGKQEP